MSKSKKIILGIATLYPIVYFFVFFSFFIDAFFRFSSFEPENAFKVLFLLQMLTMAIILVLLVVYIRDLFKNDSVPKDKKALWAVALFLGNMIAMPIYYYFYIWKK